MCFIFDLMVCILQALIAHIVIFGGRMKQIDAAKHIFDDHDRMLISLLRQDGRAPVSKLAQIMGVSRGTVQTRMDRLLETGALLGFTARVREDYDQSAIQAVMMIEVMGKNTSQVIRRLRGLPELQVLHTTSGKWDLIADLRVETLQEFDRVLREVRLIDGVMNSETSILLSSV